MSTYDDPVRDYMSTPVETARPDETLETVHGRLATMGISSLAVVEGDRLAGVVSRSDLLRDLALQKGPRRPVSDVMTRDAEVVHAEESLADAARLMVRRSIHRVFVTDGDRLAGVLSTRDLIKAIRDQRDQRPISELMSFPLFTVDVDAPIREATELLTEARISGVIVTENGWPVGVFRQTDALQTARLDPRAPVDWAMDPAVICMPQETLLHRVAHQAFTMNVRRVVASHNREPAGVLSGLDFARAVAGRPN